jgi:hypothetical protein
VLAPSTFWSLHDICSPCRSCAYAADIPVTACHPLATTALYPPRRLYDHRLSSTRRANGVRAQPTFVLLCGIRSPCGLYSRPADGVLSPPPFWSLGTIRSPRRRCTLHANIHVAAYCPLTSPSMCSPCYHVPSARTVVGVLVLLTFRSLRAISLPCQQWTPSRVDFAVPASHPLVMPVVFVPHPLSSHCVSSPHRNSGVAAPPTFRLPRGICSPRWPPASFTTVYHLLIVPVVCWPHRLSGRRISSADCADDVRAPLTLWSPLPSARLAGGQRSVPAFRSLSVIRFRHCPCARPANRGLNSPAGPRAARRHLGQSSPSRYF